jgi:hypothetical protein
MQVGVSENVCNKCILVIKCVMRDRVSQTVQITNHSVTVLFVQLLSDCRLLQWGATIAHSVWYLSYGLDV